MAVALTDMHDRAIASIAKVCFLAGLEDGRTIERPRTSTDLAQYLDLSGNLHLPIIEKWERHERQAMLDVYRAGFMISSGRTALPVP